VLDLPHLSGFLQPLLDPLAEGMPPEVRFVEGLGERLPAGRNRVQGDLDQRRQDRVVRLGRKERVLDGVL
jgi:hypothetical protein